VLLALRQDCVNLVGCEPYIHKAGPVDAPYVPEVQAGIDDQRQRSLGMPQIAAVDPVLEGVEIIVTRAPSLLDS
jgi:hypothetical protein